MHLPKEKRKKLDSKAVRGYFVGYGKDVKGFRIWFPDKDKVETHRDVIFKEDDQYLEVSNETGQDEPVQIFVFPENETNEQLAGQPNLLDSEESSDDENSEEENRWDSADEIPELQQQAPRLEEQVVEVPQARVLRDRERIRRPSRYQGVDPDTVLIAQGEELRVTKRQSMGRTQANGSMRRTKK